MRFNFFRGRGGNRAATPTSDNAPSAPPPPQSTGPRHPAPGHLVPASAAPPRHPRRGQEKGGEAEELDWVADYIVEFLKSPEWIIPLQNFIDEQCIIFDNEEENKFTYTQCHQDFQNLVDTLLTNHLMGEVGITAEQFEKVCAKMMAAHAEFTQRRSAPLAPPSPDDNPELIRNYRHYRLHQLLVEQLLSIDDFLCFKAMMVRRNMELECQALDMLRREYALGEGYDTPGPSDAPEKPGKGKGEDVKGEAVEDEWHYYEDEERELQEALRLSRELYEKDHHDDSGEYDDDDDEDDELQRALEESIRDEEERILREERKAAQQQQQEEAGDAPASPPPAAAAAAAAAAVSARAAVPDTFVDASFPPVPLGEDNELKPPKTKKEKRKKSPRPLTPSSAPDEPLSSSAAEPSLPPLKGAGGHGMEGIVLPKLTPHEIAMLQGEAYQRRQRAHEAMQSHIDGHLGVDRSEPSGAPKDLFASLGLNARRDAGDRKEPTAEELAQRMEHLRRQRDVLLAKKKEEREKQLVLYQQRKTPQRPESGDKSVDAKLQSVQESLLKMAADSDKKDEKDEELLGFEEMLRRQELTRKLKEEMLDKGRQ
ncbi:unnamed protein product [Vitrella brassicaformis CCMP3155]|uniref:Cilia- and flagella-associated protein 36 n=1 Tax=Vitrella brassicaformis (strain CCMP3155) TaxID=1169540 RepID=A0A0G4H106_VITBC|nr:unnamed protein product [Vitrella brassicaformis CCMP3155]|eukprot:CEM37227.1 unnamed protein product [Vitrella brassicaformis CCMP3155]